jgi:molybdopterin/thiamine biosynthesis adenylyltransferase
MDLFGSGSAYDEASAALEKALQRRVPNATSLSCRDLSIYELTKFIGGWTYVCAIAGTDYRFHVLLGDTFPRSPIRVAIADEDKYLVWPHVEKHGLLCLPRSDLPGVDIDAALNAALDAAENLVYRCSTESGFVEKELGDEFLSYWDHALEGDAPKLYSLLNATDKTTRLASLWEGTSFSVAADDEEQLRRWLKRRGFSKEPRMGRALVGHLSKPPTPPFPRTASDFLRHLEQGAAEVSKLFAERLLALGETTFVLGAESSNGVGLVAYRLAIRDHKGFRPNHELPENAKRVFWSTKGRLMPLKLVRVDAPWAHGRGKNEEQPILERATVSILGCGSVGSEVAVLLAQAGVGSMMFVDPQLLEAANVGRHTLGMDDVGRFKATALSKHLGERFPHMGPLDDFTNRWEDLSTENRERVLSANVVVSCIGEWSAEGLLNEWKVRSGSGHAIVFGWLDEQGVAAHAVSLLDRSPCLACVLDGNGELRAAEALWKGGSRMQTEPACGALYQPFGPLDVSQAAKLIASAVIELLTGRMLGSSHRVYACATARVEGLGGEWSTTHLKHRPAGFEGAFEYERGIAALPACPVCAS